MSQHELEVLANDLIREELKGTGLKVLRGIQQAIAERKRWATILQGQIDELEHLRQDLFTAYAELNAFKVEQIRLALHELVSRGCKEATETSAKDSFAGV